MIRVNESKFDRTLTIIDMNADADSAFVLYKCVGGSEVVGWNGRWRGRLEATHLDGGVLVVAERLGLAVLEEHAQHVGQDGRQQRRRVRARRGKRLQHMYDAELVYSVLYCTQSATSRLQYGVRLMQSDKLYLCKYTKYCN